MKRVGTFAAVLAGACIASQGWAAIASVDMNGDGAGEFDMASGAQSVFNGDTNAWTNGQLRIVHDSLADDGIVTKRRVTIVLAETNEGMSLMTLVDSFWDGGSNAVRELGFSSATSSDAGTWHANNVGEPGMQFGSDSADGTFGWREGASPDGFAWTNLDNGDHVDIALEWGGGAGLASNKPIQFVTWDEDAEGRGEWVRLGRYNFDEQGNFGMGFDIVPSPGALMLLGVAALLSWRRRR